jgi:hypothetical protein
MNRFSRLELANHSHFVFFTADSLFFAIEIFLALLETNFGHEQCRFVNGVLYFLHNFLSEPPPMKTTMESRTSGLGSQAQLRVTETKRRGLSAPWSEAPRSACHISTPSRARLGACSVGRVTGLENSRFSDQPVAEATLIVVVFTCSQESASGPARARTIWVVIIGELMATVAGNQARRAGCWSV